MGLTQQQRRALRVIQAFARGGEAPSYAELADALGYASKKRIHDLVTGLQERGKISARSDLARSIRITEEPSDGLCGTDYSPPPFLRSLQAIDRVRGAA
jgi:SOS-response transcriptional repressor LexA